MKQEHLFQIRYTPEQDESVYEQLTFESSYDGSYQVVDVYSPQGDKSENRPVILAPHPITWRASEEYSGGPEFLYKEFHCGYFGLAEKYGVIIALPHGHHRKEDKSSLAYAGQIEDLASIPDILEKNGYGVDRTRIYIMGNSMGGQEALVTAGKHPELIAACVASNPVVDLAAWYEDLANADDREIKKFRTWEVISNEVGCIPSEAPDKYAERSAFAYLDALQKIPIYIAWSHKDGIVPNQYSKHSYRLYSEIKKANPYAPICEFNHTYSHGITENIETYAKQLHEWSDYDLYIQWCLRWVKPQ